MKTLESYKAFSVVAWITVVLFSLFTFKLVTDLNKSVQSLDQKLTASQGRDVQ